MITPKGFSFPLFKQFTEAFQLGDWFCNVFFFFLASVSIFLSCKQIFAMLKDKEKKISE